MSKREFRWLLVATVCMVGLFAVYFIAAWVESVG